MYQELCQGIEPVSKTRKRHGTMSCDYHKDHPKVHCRLSQGSIRKSCTDFGCVRAISKSVLENALLDFALTNKNVKTLMFTYNSAVNH